MKIILALDGSPESLAAIHEIAKLPWSQPPTVTAVTALADPPHHLIATDGEQSLAELEREAATQNFETARQILDGCCESIESWLERRHPRQLILDAAKQQDADLIVMGARGHSAAYRVLLGSTADYVANHAKCSVLTVRNAQAPDDSMQEAREFRIVMAYDGSEAAQEGYRQLCDFRWPAGTTSVHLSMALERPKMIPDDVVYDPPLVADSESMLSQLKRPDEIADQVHQSVREALHIGNSIRSLAERKEANLVFVGDTGKSAVARFLLGSTSRYLLHHLSCSLWIARKKQWH